jgi:hypothetical protein
VGLNTAVGNGEGVGVGGNHTGVSLAVAVGSTSSLVGSAAFIGTKQADSKTLPTSNVKKERRKITALL